MTLVLVSVSSAMISQSRVVSCKPRYPRRRAGVRGCRGCSPTAAQGYQPTGRPPYPPRRLVRPLRLGGQHRTGLGDVVADLGDEPLQRGVATHLPKVSHEIQRDLLAVEVTVEVEQVR